MSDLLNYMLWELDQKGKAGNGCTTVSFEQSREEIKQMAIEKIKQQPFFGEDDE